MKPSLKAGDVIVLLLEPVIDFLRHAELFGGECLPTDGTYDECTDTRDRLEAIKQIAKARKPTLDPVYGKNGRLTQLWRRTN